MKPADVPRDPARATGLRPGEPGHLCLQFLGDGLPARRDTRLDEGNIAIHVLDPGWAASACCPMCLALLCLVIRTTLFMKPYKRSKPRNPATDGTAGAPNG